MRAGEVFLAVVVIFVVGMIAVMGYGAQVVAVKQGIVTATNVPFGASHTNADVKFADGTTVNAVWSLNSNSGCEPRVGDHVTVTFDKALWLPQLTGDSNC